MRLKILLLAVGACCAIVGLLEAQHNRYIRDEIAGRLNAPRDPVAMRHMRGIEDRNWRGGGAARSDVLQSDVMTLPASLAQQTKALSDRYMFFARVNSNGSKVPLILYLHGSGGHRRDVASLINSPIARKVTQKQYPFAVLIPQYKPSPGVPNGWQPDDLNLLIQHAVASHGIDPDRIYVTGSSMGGAGTLMLANKYPEVIAAAAPMAAGGAESPRGKLPVSPSKLKNVAIWAFHGDADRTCPHEKIQALIEEIEAVGGKPKFTLIPGGNHAATGKIYREDQLYEWFLQQRRSL
jgi:predicted peptidase